MKQFQSQIISNKQISPHYHAAEITWPITENPEAGQFITVKSSESTSPLLRRPFAVADFNKDHRLAKIIYERRGQATKLLSGILPGENISVLGPLGNRFPFPKDRKNLFLAAGGIGIGPILNLYWRLLENGYTPNLVLGFPEAGSVPKEILPMENPTTLICTDDGTMGFHGHPVKYIKTLDKKILQHTVLYACGPKPMLVGCNNLAEKYNMECWVAMEQVMACGVGACMGCAIRVNGDKQYARVCTDGPVFRSRDIVWT